MKLPPPPISLTELLSHAKVAWQHWNVQSMVLTSFIIQLLLIFLAPFRKNTSNTVIVASIWLAYLLADWIAIQAIGLISNPFTTAASAADHELYAFWTQFLLLHLGGPDTITALALEDNELWLRTGLHLAVQVYGGLGILVKSVGQSQTSLWLPTLLMFTAGVIKYTERLSSLFHGRLPTFSSLPEVSEPTVDANGKGDAELVRNAFYFVKVFKGELYTSQQTPHIKRLLFRHYMCKRSSEEVFTVQEIQFNFMYEAFYTKTALIPSIKWKALRLAVTLLQLGCLVIWLFFTDKDGLQRYNIRVTYTLLVGAVAVDVLAFLRIQLFSDWTIALRVTDTSNRAVLWFYNMVLSARKRTWGRYIRREDAPFWTCFRRALFRRWSESIPQLSLISLGSSDKSNKVLKFLGFEKEITQSKYVSRKWFTNHLRDFICEDLVEKVKRRGTVENIGKVKGGWACWDLMSKYDKEVINIPFICKILDNHEEYYVILIRWHIITEGCYHDDHLSDDKIDATNASGSGSKINLEDKECNYKEICTTLSNYMMYLLVHHHDMLSIPAIASEKLQYTYEQMKAMFTKYPDTSSTQNGHAERYRQSCKLVIDFFTTNIYNMTPHDGGGSAYRFCSKKILVELDELEKKQIGKWEFMAKVWGELLYYGAIQCKPNLHATNLKQGGELLSFAWSLLVQMGFGKEVGDTYKHEEVLLYASNIKSCSHPFNPRQAWPIVEPEPVARPEPGPGPPMPIQLIVRK